MLRLIVSFTVLGFSAVAHAAPWEIQSVEVREVYDAQSAPLPKMVNDCSELGSKPFLADNIGWDQIVNIGEKVWAIIEANKPVVTVETPVAHALPRGLECWADLEHWQAPRTQSYEVLYKNGFGMEVVKFRFRLHYTYGGGKAELGQYLANVAVLPSELNVMWGYTFNAKVEVAQAINMGSKENPLAGLEMNVRWNAKTVLKESENSFHFFVSGDGKAIASR